MSELLVPKTEMSQKPETLPLPDSVEVNELYWHIKERGQLVGQESFDWREAGAILMLVETLGANYLIEPMHEDFSLVTRVNEDTKKTYNFAIPFIRCQANPDEIIRVGEILTIFDINRKTRVLEPGASFKTSPVKTVMYLK